MCTALAHKDTFDACPADGTWFSGAVIDSKMIFTATVDPIEGGAIPANAFLQDLANRSMQRLRLFLCD
jgi:hypothetical protein